METTMARKRLRSTSKTKDPDVKTHVTARQSKPNVDVLIIDAITSLKQPKGCSRQSIQDYIFASNKLTDNKQNRRFVTQTIERNIQSGVLVNVSKTLFIKLAAGKVSQVKETSKRVGKEKTSTSKKHGIKERKTGKETIKRKQPGNKRVTAKQSATESSKKARNHEKETRKTRPRNALNTSKGTKQKVPCDRNENSKDVRTNKIAIEHATTKDKRSRTRTKQVEQRPKKTNIKQRKTRVPIAKIDRVSGNRFSPKTEEFPSSSRNTQLQIPSIGDPSTETSNITARLLETIPIDTEEKRFFGPRVTVYAVAVANDGRKLIAEQSGLIQLYSPDFKLISTLQLKNATPYDIAIHSENEAVVATGGLLYLIDFSRNFLTVSYTFFETTYHVSHLTSCRDDIFVTCLRDNIQSVKKIDSAGNVYWTTEFEQPHSITSYTKDESVVVAVTDDSKCTLTLLDGDTGEVLAVRQSQKLNPRGCTADSLGNIFLFYVHSFTVGAVSFISADLTAEKILSATKAGDTIYPNADSYDLGSTYPVGLSWDETRRQLLVAVYPDTVHVFAVE